MVTPRKKQGNPGFRHRVRPPAAIESRLFEQISPGRLTHLKPVKDKQRSLRSLVLPLPVMTAIVLSQLFEQGIKCLSSTAIDRIGQSHSTPTTGCQNP